MNHIIFFVKYPEKGKVKTRLAKSIGDEHALGLYKCMVEDILAMLKDTGIDFTIFYSPDDKENELKEWLGDNKFVAQQGKDLGEKMKNAFTFVFKDDEIKNAIIIGSDSPDIPEKLIFEAFDPLEKNEAVIGPSFDGGYYLLGFTKQSFIPEVFNGIDWSTEKVFEQTMKILLDHNKKVSLLQRWADIDTIDELKEFAEKNKNKESLTMQYIKDNKLLN
tara:strand:+ start:7137 stop:7793 length:657 start_codon:yes stop_codon:yes gene_type:complete